MFVNKRGRKGQMELSFSMIFSVILIVAFIAAAIYAISTLLGLQRCAQIGLYKDELQKAVNNAWNSPETEAKFKQNLPNSVEQVCFFNKLEAGKGNDRQVYDIIRSYDYNILFLPLKKACSSIIGYGIEHLNITEMTKQHNPYCVKKGKDMTIEKGFDEITVRIK